jgi:hypothetical protein
LVVGAGASTGFFILAIGRTIRKKTTAAMMMKLMTVNKKVP